MKFIKPSSIRAFSVVEVMVATVIAASLVGVVYNLMSWSFGTNKVNQQYTDSILEARMVLLKIQKELREAKDLIYPSTITNTEIISTQSLIYKDRNGLLKIINYDKQNSQLKLYSIPIDSSGNMEISKGSFESNINGTFKNNESKYILGSNVKNIQFTYRKRYPKVLQFRIQINKYNLVNALRLLNV